MYVTCWYELVRAWLWRRVSDRHRGVRVNPGVIHRSAAGATLSPGPQLRPNEPVNGRAALIVNHQHGSTRPTARPRCTPGQSSSRLTVPVVSTVQLFNWWRAGNSTSIRSDLFGQSAAVTEPTDEAAVLAVASTSRHVGDGGGLGEARSSNDPAP